MTPPEDTSVLSWIADKVWVICAALVGIVWRNNDAKHKETRQAAADALAEHVAQDEKEFKSLHDEQLVQRGHIAKLFDQMREESRRSDERHRELMERSHDSQRDLLVALNHKADR